MTRIVYLHCWNANEVLYQADGHTDDGRFVFVRYRRPYFSVGIGSTPDEAVGDDSFVSDACPNFNPTRINRGVLEGWTQGRFTWPERIDGYANEAAEGG